MIVDVVTENRAESDEEGRAENETVYATIKTSAAKLFASQGVGATSMRQIARAAGLHVSSLYYYFATKDQLYRAVIGDALDVIGEAASRSLKTSGGAKSHLEHFVGAIIDLFASETVEMALIEQCLHGPNSKYSLEIGKAVILERRDVRQQITEIIESTSADILKRIPADRLGDLIFAMIYGIVTFRAMRESVNSSERLTTVAITEEVMAMLDAMLGLSSQKE
jgi:AcrR family transcriptional regulator